MFNPTSSSILILTSWLCFLISHNRDIVKSPWDKETDKERHLKLRCHSVFQKARIEIYTFSTVWQLQRNNINIDLLALQTKSYKQNTASEGWKAVQ